MKRKLLAGFMAVCLILTLLPATALAGDEDTQPTVRTSVTDEETLRKAIEDASAGDVIQLSSSFAITKPISVEKELTLDLNGKTISVENDIWDMETAAYSLVSVSKEGDLTITGDGTLQAKENDSYAVDVRQGGKCTIQSGTFVGNVHSVYVLQGTLVVNGGTFSVQQIFSEDQPYQFVLNCRDENYKNGTANITVNGGSFVKFDPYNCEAEGMGTNFCAPGYVSVADGDNYEVIPAVAEADGKYYATLAEAVDAVVSSSDKAGTVTLLKDAQGCGIGLFNSKGHTGVDLTIDFGGHTYTSGDPAVGSAGTESQAFHLEQGNTVTLKNGKITVVEDSANTNTQMLIQNYCDLTLEDLVVDTSNSTKVSYAMSNNCGNVNIIGNTSIKAHDGAVAFDVCGYAKYTGVHVTVNTTGQIVGEVELSRSSGNNNPVRLSILNGDFTGAFDNQDDQAEISITGGRFSEKPEDAYLKVTGGAFVQDAQGYWTVGSKAGMEAETTTNGNTANVTVGGTFVPQEMVIMWMMRATPSTSPLPPRNPPPLRKWPSAAMLWRVCPARVMTWPSIPMSPL